MSENSADAQDPLGLTQFKIPLNKINPTEVFRTRGGFQISYRMYSAWSEDLIVLFHGMGTDSRYLAVLASAWAEENLATVVTPDFRGHGASFGAADEISEGQLEQDFEELLIYLRMQRSVRRIFIAGHSMGGGFVFRLLSGEAASRFSGALAIAPYLPPQYAAQMPHWGNWVSWTADGGTRVNKPPALRLGQDKLLYSAAYLRSIFPLDDFISRLHSDNELLVVVGEKDQVMDAARFAPVFSGVPHVQCVVVPGANHFSVVMAPDYVAVLTALMKKNFLLA